MKYFIRGAWALLVIAALAACEAAVHSPASAPEEAATAPVEAVEEAVSGADVQNVVRASSQQKGNWDGRIRCYWTATNPHRATVVANIRCILDREQNYAPGHIERWKRALYEMSMGREGEAPGVTLWHVDQYAANAPDHWRWGAVRRHMTTIGRCGKLPKVVHEGQPREGECWTPDVYFDGVAQGVDGISDVRYAVKYHRIKWTFYGRSNDTVDPTTAVAGWFGGKWVKLVEVRDDDQMNLDIARRYPRNQGNPRNLPIGSVYVRNWVTASADVEFDLKFFVRNRSTGKFEHVSTERHTLPAGSKSVDGVVAGRCASIHPVDSWGGRIFQSPQSIRCSG